MLRIFHILFPHLIDNVNTKGNDVLVMPATAKTTAEQIAQDMGDDGLEFTTPSGEEFSDYLDQIEVVKYEENSDYDRQRWEFEDGSAIVIVEDDDEEGKSWDVEAPGQKFKQNYEV